MRRELASILISSLCGCGAAEAPSTVNDPAPRRPFVAAGAPTSMQPVELAAPRGPLTVQVAQVAHGSSRAVFSASAPGGASLRVTEGAATEIAPGTFVASLVPGRNVVRVEAIDGGSAAEVELVMTSPVAGGLQHGLAVIDGVVLAWGMNADGQLGTGDREARDAPVAIDVLPQVHSVYANGNSSVAVGVDGSAWIWGALASSLGEGETSVPREIPGASGVIAAALGGSHVLLLREDGNVLALGGNAAGQLGDGSTDPSGSPVAVEGLSEVVKLAAGTEFSVAVRADGTVWAWGANGDGQLGNGDIDSEPHPLPAQVPGPASVIDVVAGRGHALALDVQGRVLAWGLGTSGQLGIGKSGMLGTRAQPVEPTVAPAAAIHAGGQASFVVGRDGSAVAFGRNGDGQLGVGNTSEQAWPMRVQGLDAPWSIGVGAAHAHAIDAAGGIWSWGSNLSGQLGVETEGTRAPAPVEVAL